MVDKTEAIILPLGGTIETTDNHDGTFTYTWKADPVFPDFAFLPPLIPKQTIKDLHQAILFQFGSYESPRRQSRRKHNRKVKRGC